jgi:N-acetylmuramoyl-L-alanine amidase
MMEAMITCLALNIFFEARNQPINGQVAVTQVVLNRVIDDRFPNDPCKVIKEGPIHNGMPVRHQCQFSWYCDGKSDTPSDKDAYRWATYVAIGVMDGDYEDEVENSTHYHADHVSPNWSFIQNRIVTIGNHIFYYWPINHD